MGSWIRYERSVLEFCSAADRSGVAAGGGNGADNNLGPAGSRAAVPQIATGAIETGRAFHAARAAFEGIFLGVGSGAVPRGGAHWVYRGVLYLRDETWRVGAGGVELFGQREYGIPMDIRRGDRAARFDERGVHVSAVCDSVFHAIHEISMGSGDRAGVRSRPTFGGSKSGSSELWQDW